jgi:hypothetical protein
MGVPCVIRVLVTDRTVVVSVAPTAFDEVRMGDRAVRIRLRPQRRPGGTTQDESGTHHRAHSGHLDGPAPRRPRETFTVRRS